MSFDYTQEEITRLAKENNFTVFTDNRGSGTSL